MKYISTFTLETADYSTVYPTVIHDYCNLNVGDIVTIAYKFYDNVEKDLVGTVKSIARLIKEVDGEWTQRTDYVLIPSVTTSKEIFRATEYFWKNAKFRKGKSIKLD